MNVHTDPVPNHGLVGIFIFMTLNLESYKILTFALILKRIRTNSVWYQGESINDFLRRLNLRMSYHTFKKYLNILLEKGLFKDMGDHKQLVSWKKIANVLGIKVRNTNGFYYLNQFLREEPFEQFTFNKAVDFVLKALIIFDLRYQNLRVNSSNYLKECSRKVLNNQRSFNSRDHQMVLDLRKYAKDAGIPTDDMAWSLINTESDYIKTGCYFLANKLGLTHQKVNVLLNEMHQDNLLHREIITQDFKVKGEISEQELQEVTEGRPFFGYNGHYRIILGSRITIPQKLRRRVSSKLKSLPDDVQKVDGVEVTTRRWKFKSKSNWTFTNPYKLTITQKKNLNM